MRLHEAFDNFIAARDRFHRGVGKEFQRLLVKLRILDAPKPKRKLPPLRIRMGEKP